MNGRNISVFSIILLIVSASTTVCAAGQASEEKFQKRERLVAWWKFDNDASDNAGDNHGHAQGDPVYEAGKFGQAISLDGDDYVDCGNSSVLNFGTGDWAVSAWIKTTWSGIDEANRGTIFANGGDDAGGIRYTLGMSEVRTGVITLTTDDNIHDKVRTTGGSRINDGAWHHVVGMRNANQLHLYIDGVLNGRSILYEDYNLSGVSQHDAYIGAITDNRNNSLYKRFVGEIDEVCVFACALDANSVSALYSGKDPLVVAEQAGVVREPKAQPQPATDVDIEGDWKVTVAAVGQIAVVKITRKADNTLTGTFISEDATVPFEVAFVNGKLRLEAASIQSALEGMIQEDGKTIEGQWQQVGQQIISVVLKRIEHVPVEISRPSDSEVSPGPPARPEDGLDGGGSGPVMTLILVLVLAGVIGAVALFVKKSA